MLATDGVVKQYISISLPSQQKLAHDSSSHPLKRDFGKLEYCWANNFIDSWIQNYWIRKLFDGKVKKKKKKKNFDDLMKHDDVQISLFHRAF